MRVEPTDAELVRRSQTGDAEAFGELYERYVDDVYRFFYYRVTQPADAEDLTEATFLRAWRSIGRVKADATLNFRAWLLRIARNLWIDRHRTARDEAPLDAAASKPAATPDPEDALLASEAHDDLTRALAQLPERLREVVLYRFVHGLSHRETAALLGVSEAHVRVLQHRALQRLRQWLTAQEE